jgi:hypothetical protein
MGVESSGLNCLLVEDQALMADLLCGILRTIPGLGGLRVAHSVSEACGLIDQRVPDLLILDLALPDGDGQQVGLYLLQRNPSPVIILLSAQLHDFCCEPALLPHIHATVDKTSAYKELANALKGLAKGSVENFVEVALPKRFQAMTLREQEVFLLIGTGKSSREIAEDLTISLSTVESHRKSIAQNIGSSGAELVRMASLHLYRMEQGLLPSPSPFDPKRRFGY